LPMRCATRWIFPKLMKVFPRKEIAVRNLRNHTKLLSWKVFVTPGVATVSDDLPPGEAVRMWSPISSTLIYGERDAVLVDAPTTVEQAEALADWVVNSGKEPDDNICHSWSWRPFLRHRHIAGPIPHRQGDRHRRGLRTHASASLASGHGGALEQAVSRSNPGAAGDGGAALRATPLTWKGMT